MDDRQVLLGNLWITTLGNSEVLIAALTEASIAAPIVSNDQRSRRDGALDEPTERLGATVEHDGEPNASGIASVFPVVELGARLSMTHLDGTGDGNLVVNTTAFPTRSPANPGFVHLNMVLGLSTDPVLVGPHHARAELVENLKGRLVARKTKLPLKQHGGHAGRLTGDQISGCVSKVVEIGFGASPSGLSFAAVRPRGQGFRRRLSGRGFPIHRLCASGFGRKRGAPRGASALFRDTAARSVF